MAEQELALLITLKNEASAQLRQMNTTIKDNTATWQDNFGAIKGQLQSAGLMLSGFGAAVVGAFGMAYKASEDDRLALARLGVTLRNVGTDYDNVKTSLNSYIEATMKSTGIGRGEQLGALNQLVLTTGNYQKAMQMLPIALDLAAAKQMDTTTAALLLGRVAEGNVNALNRYGFSMVGVKDPAQALDIIQQKVAGSAQAMLSPFEALKTQLMELGSEIGDLVAGPFGSVLKAIADIVIKAREWTKANPELASTLADVGIAIGIGALATGGLALATLGLAAALAILGGPITLILLGIAALAAMAVFLALKWGDFKAQWVNIWPIIIAAAWFALGPIGTVIMFLIQSALDIISAWDSAKSLWENIWNGIKIICRDAINDIIGLINLPIKALNTLLSALGMAQKDLAATIPTLSSNIWGIYTSPTVSSGIGGGGWPGGEVPIGGAVNAWGNYGNLGATAQSGGITVNINNAGSVISDQDLMNQIRQLLIQLQNRNGTTGLK